MTNRDTKNFSDVRLRVYLSISPKIAKLSFDLILGLSSSESWFWLYKIVMVDIWGLYLQTMSTLALMCKINYSGALEYQEVGSDHKNFFRPTVVGPHDDLAKKVKLWSLSLKLRNWRFLIIRNQFWLWKFAQTYYWGSTRPFCQNCQLYSLIMWLHILGSFGNRNTVMGKKTSLDWPFEV